MSVLKKHRLEAGYRQEGAAKALDVQRQTYAEYEKEPKKLDTCQIEKLAELFGLSGLDLYTEIASMEDHRAKSN